MRTIRRIIIHHTASSQDITFEQIRAGHIARGFSDIGYHRVVLGDGTVRRGREIDKIGAHAAGANKDSIGVCICGDNTRPEHRWRPVQIASARKLIHALRFVFPDTALLAHHEVKATLCPGLTGDEVREMFDE